MRFFPFPLLRGAGRGWGREGVGLGREGGFENEVAQGKGGGGWGGGGKGGGWGGMVVEKGGGDEMGQKGEDGVCSDGGGRLNAGAGKMMVQKGEGIGGWGGIFWA